MRIVGWRIYYADESTVDSTESSWVDAPDDGVIAIAVHYGRTKKLMLGNHDWYFSDGDQLVGCNDDPREEVERRYPSCSLKRGQWVSTPLYEVIRLRALKSEM